MSTTYFKCTMDYQYVQLLSQDLNYVYNLESGVCTITEIDCNAWKQNNYFNNSLECLSPAITRKYIDENCSNYHCSVLWLNQHGLLSKALIRQRLSAQCLPFSSILATRLAHMQVEWFKHANVNHRFLGIRIRD